jgi:hypothetical protein
MTFKRTKSSFSGLLKKKYQQPSNFKELIYVLKFNGRLFFTNFIGIEHFFYLHPDFKQEIPFILIVLTNPLVL